MNNDDQEIERYLREFQPRGVKSLEIPHIAGIRRRKWMAAAAVVAMCVGSGVWYARHGHGTISRAPVETSRVEATATVARPNVFSLTRLALEDDAQFQAQLAAESRAVLPSFQDPRSAFHVLAKE